MASNLQEYAVVAVTEEGYVERGDFDKVMTFKGPMGAADAALGETVRVSGRVPRMWFETLAFRRGMRAEQVPDYKREPDFDKHGCDVVTKLTQLEAGWWLAREWVRWPEGDVTVHDSERAATFGELVRWAKAEMAEQFTDLPCAIVFDGEKIYDSEWDVDHSADQRWS